MTMWLGIHIAGPCFLSVELHVYTPFNLLRSGDCQGTLHEPLGMQSIMVLGTIQFHALWYLNTASVIFEVHNYTNRNINCGAGCESNNHAAWRLCFGILYVTC